MRLIAFAVTMISLWLLTGYAALAQDTTIIIPWGQWVAEYVLPLAGFVAVVLVIIAFGFVIKFLPPWAQGLVETQFRDQLVKLATDAINAGVQGVKGAVFDKELSIDVGNAVIAKAAQEAIDTWPPKVVEKLGGVEGVAKWLLTQAEARGVIINANTSTAEILASADMLAVDGNPPQP